MIPIIGLKYTAPRKHPTHSTHFANDYLTVKFYSSFNFHVCSHVENHCTLNLQENPYVDNICLHNSTNPRA